MKTVSGSIRLTCTGQADELSPPGAGQGTSWSGTTSLVPGILPWPERETDGEADDQDDRERQHGPVGCGQESDETMNGASEEPSAEVNSTILLVGTE